MTYYQMATTLCPPSLLKVAITSDPCLAHFNLTILIFLKTDWSNVGMSFVLMQPANDDTSRIALAILQQDNSLNTFDELMSGAQLKPVCFISRCGTDHECHFHSFVSEAVTGHWAICQNC